MKAWKQSLDSDRSGQLTKEELIGAVKKLEWDGNAGRGKDRIEPMKSTNNRFHQFRVFLEISGFFGRICQIVLQSRQCLQVSDFFGKIRQHFMIFHHTVDLLKRKVDKKNQKN